VPLPSAGCLLLLLLLLPAAGESKLCAGAFSSPGWRPAKAPHNNEQMLSKASFSGRQASLAACPSVTQSAFHLGAEPAPPAGERSRREASARSLKAMRPRPVGRGEGSGLPAGRVGVRWGGRARGRPHTQLQSIPTGDPRAR